MKYILTVLLLSVFATSSLYAQRRAPKNRFTAGVVMGVNTSQINGDRYSGYDKFGGFAGFRVVARITTSSELAIEMQYNRKGSRDPRQFIPGQKRTRFISLDYIEVPILYHRRVRTNIGMIGIEGGIAYARLLGVRINENANTINYASFTNIQNEFNKNELGVILGGGVFVNKHIRIMARFSYSLTLLYENENPVYDLTVSSPEMNHLKNMQLALGMNYIF